MRRRALIALYELSLFCARNVTAVVETVWRKNKGATSLYSHVQAVLVVRRSVVRHIHLAVQQDRIHTAPTCDSQMNFRSHLAWICYCQE